MISHALHGTDYNIMGELIEYLSLFFGILFLASACLFLATGAGGPCSSSDKHFRECVSNSGTIAVCTEMLRLQGCNPDGTEYAP